MVNKFTTPPKNDELINKVNEVIDNLSITDQTFDGTSQNAQSGVAIADELIYYVPTYSGNNINITSDDSINFITPSDSSLTLNGNPILSQYTTFDNGGSLEISEQSLSYFDSNGNDLLDVQPGNLAKLMTVNNNNISRIDVYSNAISLSQSVDGGTNYYNADITIPANGKIAINGTEVQEKLVSGTSIKTINNQSLLGSDNLNLVTTDTAQDISGRKTFLGEKAIYFKQSATSNKLGFTLYNPSNTELGAFEYRPNTISGGALLNVNVPYSSSDYVGFRYWGTAVNIIAPKVSTAGSYYIPTHITNGTTTVTANSTGTVNVSSLLSDFVTNSSLATTLSSYATQSWVGQQGFLTGITSSDVTTALGYTPVNKAGDTMSGKLNFITNYSNSDIRQSITLSDVTLGTLPSENYFTGFQTKDSQGYEFANVNCSYNTNGRIGGNFYLRRNINGSNINSSLGIYMDASGNVTTSAPTPSANSDDTSIATTEWVNDATKSTNVVHRDTAETIAGAKTFTDNLTIERSTYSRCVFKTTDWTKGTNPASSTNSGVTIEDVNGDGTTAHRMGEFITQLNSNGSIYSAIGVYKNEAGTTSSQIRIGYNTGGNVYTYAPASDANDSIVTTVAKSKSANGYYKLGNGLIIQWGRFQNSANSVAVTFPTAFSSTNYYARATQEQSSSTSGEYGQGSSFTTTGCNFTAYKGANYYSRWIAIGY